jgi:prepilin-type N-terminal cleavage/methylation domain-containing protein
MYTPRYARVLKRGFSLIELIFVMSMIALFASLVLSSMSGYRNKAVDIKRVGEMGSIKKALELYYTAHLGYPDGDGDGCGGWDIGNVTYPLFNGRGMDSYFSTNKAPVDPNRADNCSGYRYYRYPAGSYGCPSSRGAFYVLGLTNMDASSYPNPDSPGFSCPGRNWQSEFYWVTGDFED